MGTPASVAAATKRGLHWHMIASAPTAMASYPRRTASASVAAVSSGTEKAMNVLGAARRMAAAGSGRLGSKRTFMVSMPASSAAAASSAVKGSVSTSTRFPFWSRRCFTV